MKNPPKNQRVIQRSCAKHGNYTGPYCPACYEKAMGSDEPSVKDSKSQSD